MKVKAAVSSKKGKRKKRSEGEERGRNSNLKPTRRGERAIEVLSIWVRATVPY